MVRRGRRSAVLGILSVLCLLSPGRAADWPTWRGDAGRSGSTREELPKELHFQWALRLPALQPAWPDEPRMRFDAAYQPVVAGASLFVGSSHDDSVRAFDLADGSQKWCVYANGPVRFAPLAWRGRLFVVSDDGYLYCLDAATGELRWKRRGGPSGRMVLGNERLISMWPARGAPVLAPEPSAPSGHAVHFAAGIWPFMGVFLYALDADSGEVLWCNDGAGATYTVQPHNSPAFAGVAPQGYLAVAGDKLLVPNGRAVAAGFDRATGRFRYFHHAAAKRTGHCEVAAVGDRFLNAAALCDLKSGAPLARVWLDGRNVGLRYSQSYHAFYDANTQEEIRPIGKLPVLWGTISYESAGDHLYACDLSRQVTRTYYDLSGKKKKGKRPRVLWRLPTRARPMLRAGGRLYAAGRGELIAVDLPTDGEVERFLEAKAADGDALLPPPRIAWREKIDETPANMIAAAGRLVVVTREGSLYCYGGAEPQGKPHDRRLFPRRGERKSPAGADEAATVLAATGAHEGYALVMGLRDGRLAERLARQPKLRVIALDADAAKVGAFRRRMDRSHLDGKRLSAVVADPRTVRLPPYLASLIVTEDPAALGPIGEMPVRKLFRILRPYGGVLCLKLDGSARAAFRKLVASADLPRAELGRAGDFTLLRRRGSLPGAGSWTHQYGSAANTCVSDDDLVRAPLGLLWFGGTSNSDILPRHGHGPPEQVVGGRLFIEGPDALRAVDVYTGRLLWQRRLEDLGRNYDYTSHEPGANALGTNYVAARDAVYVVHGRTCLRLDPATGRTLGELRLPAGDGDAGHAPLWGYLGAWEDLLVAGATPMKLDSPDLTGADFRRLVKAADRKGGAFYANSRTRALCEAIEKWKDFEPERPKVVLQPPPDIQPSREPTTRPAVDVDFIIANVGRMIRRTDMLGRLPAEVVAAARKRCAKDVAAWEKARRTRRDFAAPKPETIDDLQAHVGALRASGEGALADGRDLLMLRRQILGHCYPTLPAWRHRKIGQATLDHTASRELVALNRHSGKVLWRRTAEAAFRHNAVCLGGGKVFCIDRLPTPAAHRLLRRGVKTHHLNRLLALDVRTGKLLWSTREHAFGTWLSYSAEHDVLVQAGRPSRDMLGDEPGTRMTAFRAAGGDVLWDKTPSKEKGFRYAGPVMLHGRTILTQGQAFDLLTGERRMREHPLTGEPIKWRFKRNYGCNYAIASRHLVTFRSAAAGYFDLAGDGGTGNLGGFKSGCTSNLIAADGVLNAPDYTRTCTCSYQNQSSLALIHMPDVEMWTFQDFDRGKEPIRRLGVNFGAPGDRRDAKGTLWLEHPTVGGPSPNVGIEADLNGKVKVDRTALAGLCWRRHSSRVRGATDDAPPWVAASGLQAAGEIHVKLAGSRAAPRTYTVRLHFAEPGGAARGERVFDVALQGETVLKALDVAAEAGAALTPVVKTFRKVAVKDKLRVALTPAAGSKLPPVLCGVEVLAERE